MSDKLSDRKQCNYCLVEGFKALASMRGAPLIIDDAPIPIMGWNDGKEVYIHYHGDESATWCGWFISIPPSCVCKPS